MDYFDRRRRDVEVLPSVPVFSGTALQRRASISFVVNDHFRDHGIPDRRLASCLIA
jgi:hypothetical protein